MFTTGALLIPVLFFAGIEGVLRLAGFGDDYPLFVEAPGHPAYRQPNPDVGRRYFAQASTVPAPPGDAFRREKEPRAFRLFVQGGSTSAGFPYGHGGAFPRMLQQRLLQTLPDRDVEVVNTAMAAVNSYTLLDFADEILAGEPDAVLVYAGHNEYYGALGVGSTEGIGSARALVRLYLALDRLRLVQLLRAGWAMLAGGTPAPEPDRAPGATLMEEMARDRSIPFEGPQFRRGVDQFRANLTDLLCRYERAGVPVYVGTLAANERDQAPFDGGPSAGTDTAAWRRQDEAARQLALRGDTAAALAALDALVRLDPAAADPHYDRARLLDGSGRREEVRAGYLAAKDRDRLRFRAPEAMNAVIREAAAACGATVVETQAALAGASPGGIIGRGLMLEHLHPNLDGAFLLADAFYRALLDALPAGERVVRVPPDEARREVLVTALDSTLAAYHVRRLLNNWPFQPPGVTRPDTIRVTTPVEEIALDVLRGRRTWTDATARLGALYEAEGNHTAALRAALALAQEQSYAVQPYLLAGNLLVKQQRFAGAVQAFQAAEARAPTAEARRMLGRLTMRAGRAAEAETWFRRALDLDPGDQAALFDLALLYAAGRRPDDARAAVNRLLELEPRHAGALRLRERLDAPPPGGG